MTAMSFKRTCALNAIFNESVLIYFASGNFLFTWKSHTCLKCHFSQNYRYEVHTGLSFISLQLIWTQVKNWRNTKKRFSIKMNLIPVWVHFASHMNVLPTSVLLAFLLRKIMYMFNRYAFKIKIITLLWKCFLTQNKITFRDLIKYFESVPPELGRSDDGKRTIF